MLRKNYLLLLIFGLVLGQELAARGQSRTQGQQVYGTFGSRMLGLSFTPRPGTFGGGVQTNPGGSFVGLGRASGVAASAAPGQVVSSGAAAQPAVSPTVGPPSSANSGNFVPAPPSTGFVPPVSPEMALQQNVVPAPKPEVVFTTAGAERNTGAAAHGQSYTLSPELSAFITRIARSKGILAGQAIDVYMSNRVARMQGVVHSPADAVLLANVLALEPNVITVENRLVAVGE